MASIYSIDYNKLIRWLLPPKLRSEFTLNWLKSLVSPIVIIYNAFILYRSDVEYRTAITPQVCYLQKVLNDTFDNTERRIIILDNPEKTVLLIHTDEANKPLMIHKVRSGHDSVTPLIHDSSSFSGGQDFTVKVPFSLTQAQEYRMMSILNNYKLISKRYKILYA
ncbi:MAG TPA: hypothetical protein VK172_14680 [Lentimicrobium sp.]|nr:hypothetical protein [Bacteroidales bacterium]HLO92407.1 hypothetical protein [Lentimicrobium sp.]